MSKGRAGGEGSQDQLELLEKPRHRFLQIFLSGGWDSALATDPIIGSKASSSTYDSRYRTPSNLLMPQTVPGKSNLQIGAGLAPAMQAFSAMPTAFVNGIFMEVTAHELASQYMLSGRLSLANSRDFPCIPALAGSGAGQFPPHVVLGSAVPLGDTRNTAPPLHASTAQGLSDYLKGPTDANFSPDSFQEALRLSKRLDEIARKKLSENQLKDVSSWHAAAEKSQQIYSRNIGSQVMLNDTIKTRYEVKEDFGAPEALFASAFLILKSGLTDYVTLNFGGFDTHSNHVDNHLPLLKRFSTVLAKLVEDLRNCEDPLFPGTTLAENTTLYITSEFVRSPQFNVQDGLDHWQSGSAIVMGKGVKDNTVVGGTGDDAKPLGWTGTSTVAGNETTHLMPEHLTSSLLRHLGFSDAAKVVSEVNLNALFV
jgi:hypothetical protein